MKFNELTSNKNTLRAVEAQGFTEPTQIQAEAIPCIKEGRDFIAQSQTGTGKTAAFAIPSIDMIDKELRGAQVLVICPTRELAVQVANEFDKLLKFEDDIQSVAVYGGEPIIKQIKKLKKNPQIVVGTPGRLRDHIRRRTVKLQNIQIVILDEADEMLKMGFVEEIEEIFEKIDHPTQNLMFSATIPKNVEKLARNYLENPVEVKIEPKNISSETVKQSYVAIHRKYKKSVVSRILDHKNPSRCIIFCNTKRMVDDLISELQAKGYSADRIHGDLKQEQRIGVLNQFNKGNISVLVATDVAGRGLDIQNVDLVINYDLPEKEDSYVHRIGRSGRAGKVGEAVTLVSSSDKKMLSSIQRYIKKDIDHHKVPSQKKVNDAKVEHFIDDCLKNADKNNVDEYADVLEYIRDKGYSLEEVTIALLEDRLNFSNELDIDYNDHYFHNAKKMGSKKSSAKKSKSNAFRKSNTKSKHRYGSGDKKYRSGKRSGGFSKNTPSKNSSKSGKKSGKKSDKRRWS